MAGNWLVREYTMTDAPCRSQEIATPFDVRMLDVDDGHSLYVEQCGSPLGVPAVYLHGGPGSGCQPDHRALFDGRFRAVLFDQRGAGRSRPARSFADNTTAKLVADLECIRTSLAIERWIVVGGSWGATLALAYAERYPVRVSGLVLRATFLGTRRELEWAFIDGPRRFRPDLFGAFVSILSDTERKDPLNAYWSRILDPDPMVHRQAAWLWHDTERILSELIPSAAIPAVRVDAAGPLPSASFMEAHYFRHDCFLEPDELLGQAERLASIPGVIVQGRYDLLCPPTSAFALAERWPGARLHIIEGAAHALSDSRVRMATVSAIDEVYRSVIRA